MGLVFGTLIALLLLITPGAIVARIAQLTWPVAIAVGPALTYGIITMAIIPFGALGIPWNGWTALATLGVIGLLATALQLLGIGGKEPAQHSHPGSQRPMIIVTAGVLLGAVFIGYAALRGIPHWQSIPSTWDAVWHANTVRFILDTGQASSTHMGELRNIETHDLLYYPSAFHALVAVFCQLTGAAATTGYTLCSLAAAIWLFPVSAAVLTWRILGSQGTAAATAAAAAAGLSASFTAVPYVEFDTAAMPYLAALGIAAPTMALITSTLRHRNRAPLAVLAFVGVFSVHTSGGLVVVLLVSAWWLCDAWWHPVRSRIADAAILAGVLLATGLVLLPQFISVKQQEDIIAGHSFLTYLSKKRGLFDAVFQHSRHLNDFPVQYALIGLAAIGGFVLLIKRHWWPLPLWLILIVANLDAGTPLGGPVGALAGKLGEFFYKDPRRLAAVTTLLLTPMAGIGLVAVAMTVVAAVRKGIEQCTHRSISAPVWTWATAMLLAAATLASTWHYFPRHRFLFGDKYDSVMVDQRDLAAMAYLARLPCAKQTLIGDANTDGTAWMYAVAGLHPLWTHYDYPMQQGPGYHRFTFWAYASKADTDPRVSEAIRVLNIRYILTSTPTVRGFVIPDGLVSLDKSKSWVKIYDNGEARIYEWHGQQDSAVAPHC